MSKVKSSWKKRKQQETRTETVRPKKAKTIKAQKKQADEVPQLPSLYFSKDDMPVFSWDYDNQSHVESVRTQTETNSIADSSVPSVQLVDIDRQVKQSMFAEVMEF
ncbi:hypothetical protein AAFC00_000239 [Neodothiora populina]